MKLYIGNCTQQVIDFWYRSLETRALRMQRIEIGSQIAISGDLSTPEIDYIVQQHTPYGLIAEESVDRTKPFIGMCFRIGKPIDINKLRRAIEHNQEVLVKRGQDIRTESAVALHQSLEQQNPLLQAVETSFVEEETKRNPDPQLAEGVRVSKEVPSDQPPTRQQRRRRVA